MSGVVIGVCTYRRPTGLKAVLTALAAQRIDGSSQRILVVIVDNSEEASARAQVAEAATTMPMRIVYEHEARRGLSHARNRVLTTAMATDARYLAFIDDDELPEVNWLQNLVGALTRLKVAAVMGPVAPVFSSRPGPLLPVDAYRTRLESRDGYVSEGYTSNCIIDLAVVRDLGLQFDPRMNATGGEDTAFFRQMTTAGHRLGWAEDARVSETVPPHRMSPMWLWRRWYGTGVIEARIALLERPTLKSQLHALVKGVARLAGGALYTLKAIVLCPWQGTHNVVASLYTVCRGAGYIGGAFGHSPNRYAGSSYR